MKASLKRIAFSETAVLITLATLVGLLSGAGIWVFKRLLDLAHWAAFDQLRPFLAGGAGAWSVLLLPVLGGLLVGGIRQRFIGEERHHGVAGIMEAAAMGGGKLRYRRIPAKTVAAALSIGSGASVGPEDPSVQLGANVGSMLGQWFHLSDERMRALVAAGAASGVAAAFNAPIAGVFFAIEIILGEIGGSALGLVLLSAVVSAVFTQAVAGPNPAFQVPQYAFKSIAELPIYFVLGLLAGPVSAVYIRLLYLAQDLFHRFQRLPRWLHPSLAGVGVGLVGIFLPQVFGVGYESIEQILAGERLGLPLLLGLMIAKLLLTPLSLGGGFLGGVFAPSLFIGAMLGGAVGELGMHLFPGLGITPAAFAMVGMAALLAGAVHAPLTAILLLFEMTRDYRIILPLMFAVLVSLALSQRLQSDSVYVHGLARKGIRLERGRDVEVLETVRVGEVMQEAGVTLQETDTLEQASRVFSETRRHGLMVLNASGELAGIFTLQDLDSAEAETWARRTVGDACTRSLLVTYPDETIGQALRRMSPRDIGRLPVVARDNPRCLMGMLRRTDLVRAYDAALSRRAAIRHRAQQTRLGSGLAHEDAAVEEIVIQPGSVCDGKAVREIVLPRDCILASLRRGPRLLIPHGDTVLHAGDILAVVADEPARAEVKKLGQN